MLDAKTAPALAPEPIGFADLPCIKCGGIDCVGVKLVDVTEFCCDSCNDTFTAEDVIAHMTGWQRVLKWLSLCPRATE